ncbi:MAG: AMP-binding protein [Spirochaetaceae bacterium]|jgi:long-chain acyl-CoA synthetase|nr:AMP-binding protein [Spirochaetaceae bacterium]
MSLKKIHQFEKSWEFLNQYKPDFVKDEWPTIPEMFHLTAHRCPQNRAFAAFAPKEYGFSYAEAEKIVLKTGQYLLSLGIKKGNKIALTGKNSPYWALAYLSIVEIGAVVVPLDYQLESENMQRLLEFADAEYLFIDKEKYDEISCKGKFSISPERDNFFMDFPQLDMVEYDKPEMTDLAAILFTSGTTGNEKGVMLTHENFMSDVFQGCHKMFLDSREEDVWYALLPLHHSYCFTAVFLESIVHGSLCVFAAGLSVSQLMSDLKLGGVTIIMGIPMLYNKILKGMMKQVRAKGLITHLIVGLLMRYSGMIKRLFDKNIGKKLFKTLLTKANLLNVKYMISGGGPLAPETFRRYQQLGLDFIQGYGMTETSPISTLNPKHHFKVKSVGRKFPLIEMKILNPDDQGIGEVAIKGNICCQGYYKNEEATKELFNEDGFLKTGDVGYMDKEDYLYLTGRAKSLIVTEGGKNVFPEEIEDHFQLYPQIEQILILGYLADKETMAEGIEAIIFPSDEHYQAQGVYNKDKILDDMAHAIKEVNRELLPYKRIHRFRIIKEAMPMTSTKKIKRPIVMAQLKETELEAHSL